MEKTVMKMRALAPSTMRRMLVQSAAQTHASRNHHQFMYPHSFKGANNAYNNIPVNQQE